MSPNHLNSFSSNYRLWQIVLLIIQTISFIRPGILLRKFMVVFTIQGWNVPILVKLSMVVYILSNEFSILTICILFLCNDKFLFNRFEILSEDGLVFTGTTPDECHKKLLSLINNNYSAKVVNDTINRGADFFGLANPSVHYLILSLPGIPKCVKYSFKKFNVRWTRLLGLPSICTWFYLIFF